MTHSPTAVELAAKIAPPIQREVQASKSEIVARAGGAFDRLAVRAGFGMIVREVPPLIESGTDALLDLFGSLSLSEIAQHLVSHAEAKGQRAHPSIRSYREF